MSFVENGTCFWRDSAIAPGGLRGGGAVQAYRAGRAISDILWAMRLGNQATLEYYLQEVAALSDLPLLARHKIKIAMFTFPHLCP